MVTFGPKSGGLGAGRSGAATAVAYGVHGVSQVVGIPTETFGSAPGALLVLVDQEVGWTMLQVGTPAALLLDRLPGWVRIHADETAVVHRRLAPGGSVP